MYAAGAPSYYMLVNIAALGVGSLAAWLIGRAPAHNPHGAGIFTVAVAMVLLGTALLGPRVDGASRWIRIAGISFQPSLLLVPVVMLLVVRNRHWLSSVGLLLVGAALALQPDRAIRTAALTVQNSLSRSSSESWWAVA